MSILNKIFGKKTQTSKQDFKDYLEGNLNHNPLREFEHSISEDGFESDALDGFQEFGMDGLEQLPNADEFVSQLEKRKKAAKIRRISPWGNRIAAMVLGVMFVSAIYMYWNENSSERLFADYFGDYADPDLYAMRSGGMDVEELNPTLEEAYSFYFEDDFEKAVFLFDSYSQENPVDDRTQFYLGLSYLKMDDARQALPYLESVVAMEASEFLNDAKWYQALSYLKLGKKEKARPLFEYLQTINDGYYDKKSREILEEI